MGRLRRPPPDFPVVSHTGGASAPTTTPNHSRPYGHRFSLILAFVPWDQPLHFNIYALP